MSESPKFIVTVSIGTFFLASAIAFGIIATANSYLGANVALAALFSFPVYFLGLLAAIRYLRLNSFRSILGWFALSLNLIPFGFMALLSGIALTGNWYLMKMPDKPHAPNPAITLWFPSEYHWRGVSAER